MKVTRWVVSNFPDSGAWDERSFFLSLSLGKKGNHVPWAVIIPNLIAMLSCMLSVKHCAHAFSQRPCSASCNSNRNFHVSRPKLRFPEELYLSPFPCNEPIRFLNSKPSKANAYSSSHSQSSLEHDSSPAASLLLLFGFCFSGDFSEQGRRYSDSGQE